jgi:D-tyrosyl-tRNA(Tyr) deacylase
MIALVQRVRASRVEVEGEVVGWIGPGMCVFLGVEKGDGDDDLNWLCSKLVNLRIFEDDVGRMNLSLLDIKGEMLLIPQFTLLGDCRKGRRPNFTLAAPPDEARALYQKAADCIRRYSVEVAQGVFQAHMLVYIENDGPVTFIINSKERGK